MYVKLNCMLVHAVAAANTIVGHVLKKCNYYLCAICFCMGVATILLGGKRSIDLPLGGLEAPCILTFIGNSQELSEVERLTGVAWPGCMCARAHD